MKPTKTPATKGTTLKYNKTIQKLQAMKKPTKINAQQFAKSNKVSTNLMIALQRMGHIKKQKDGLIWNPTTEPSMDIAEKARVIMNEMTNKRKPTRERPSDTRTFKGRITKNKPAVKVKKIFKAKPAKVSKIVQSSVKASKISKIAKAIKTTSTDKKMRLVKKFALLGDYDFALELLEK